MAALVDCAVGCTRTLAVQLDSNGCITAAIGAAWFGYAADELVGRHVSVLFAPDERARLEAVLATGSASVLLRKDGTSVDVDLWTRSVGDETQLVASAGTRLAQTRRFEQHLHDILDALPEPIIVHDRGTIVSVNRSVLELLGYTAAELVGRQALDLVHPDDVAVVTGALSQSLRNRRTPEHRLMTAQGVAIPVEVTAVPCPFDGRIAAVATIHDLRERKRLEAQLAAADRMATLGRLAATVGHEINNPLTYMLVLLDKLLGEMPATGERDELRADLNAVRDGASRIRDIVSDLGGLSRPTDEPAGPVDLRRVLEAAVASTRHELEHRARLRRDEPDVGMVIGVERHLVQVFVNLLVNAAQALDDGDRSSHEVRIVVRAIDAERVTIEIHDTGIGLPADPARLFDPFFTTKPSTGTGLGLSIAHRIVTGFGGTIEAEPGAPRGACFRVTLRSAPPATRAAAPRAPTARDTIKGCVLFVDDEPMIRNIGASLLSEFEVVTAGSGREAIECLESGQAFDAIVCDLQMPDLGGPAVYAWVAEHRPDLTPRIVFMTGGAFGRAAKEFLDTVQPRCLAKPFDLANVADAISSLLASP